MTIFGMIKNAIRGHKPVAVEAAPSTAAMPQVSTLSDPGNPPPAETAAAAPTMSVDVDAILTEKAIAHGEPLNWRTSIVDLMKLLGLDSSLQNRRELAAELGYAGDREDSATMNIWLHMHVMARLAESGGTVPVELTNQRSNHAYP